MDAPITKTFWGPFATAPSALTRAICSLTLASQPVGWVVVQINPRVFGLIITLDVSVIVLLLLYCPQFTKLIRVESFLLLFSISV